MENLGLKQYEIYKYNEAFYTREELEKIGFIHFNRNDFINLKKNNNFEVVYDFGEKEVPLDYNKILENEFFDDCFIINSHNCVRILNVDKCYVLELGNAICVCDDIDLEKEIIEEMQQSCQRVLLRNSKTDDNSKDYAKQKQLQKSMNNLKEMISSK